MRLSWNEYRPHIRRIGTSIFSNEGFRQIEAKALRKLKHPSRSKQLKSFRVMPFK